MYLDGHDIRSHRRRKTSADHRLTAAIPARQGGVLHGVAFLAGGVSFLSLILLALLTLRGSYHDSPTPTGQVPPAPVRSFFWLDPSPSDPQVTESPAVGSAEADSTGPAPAVRPPAATPTPAPTAAVAVPAPPPMAAPTSLCPPPLPPPTPTKKPKGRPSKAPVGSA